MPVVFSSRQVNLMNELDALLARREALRVNSLLSSRARTASVDAEADWVNERILWVREELKKV